jgi:hypothetical protein
MRKSEFLTPSQAAEESAKRFATENNAVASVEQAWQTIYWAENNAIAPERTEYLATHDTWLVQWWSGHELHERVERLKKVRDSSDRNFAQHRSLLHTAALAEAMLSGIEIN